MATLLLVLCYPFILKTNNKRLSYRIIKCTGTLVINLDLSWFNFEIMHTFQNYDAFQSYFQNFFKTFFYLISRSVKTTIVCFFFLILTLEAIKTLIK